MMQQLGFQEATYPVEPELDFPGHSVSKEALPLLKMHTTRESHLILPCASFQQGGRTKEENNFDSLKKMSTLQKFFNL